MGLLENIGRTNTLSNESNRILKMAIELPQRKLEMEEGALIRKQREQQIDLDRLKLQKEKREDEDFNTVLPISTLKNRFQVPGAADYAEQLADSMGYIDRSNDIEPTIKRGYAMDIYKQLHEKEHGMQLSLIRMKHWKSKRDIALEKLNMLTEKGANEKELAKWKAVYENAETQYGTAVGQNDALIKYYESEKAKEPEVEMLTVYGPKGATKRVPVEKGTEYTPPAGWTLQKPSATATELKIGQTKEKLLMKKAAGQKWTKPEQDAWNLLSQDEKEIGKETLRLLSNDPRFKMAKPEKKREMIRETEAIVRETLGATEQGGESGGVEAHPLAGRPPGRYRIDGREVRWNGEQEIE